MKAILLTRGKVALIDDADYKWLNQWKWFAKQDIHTFYAARVIIFGKGKRRAEQMHRLILGLQPSDKQQTDHIDGDGLNNQRSNLRICTAMQNQQSSRKRKAGTSKYKGIYWHPNCKWCSQIMVSKKKVNLGYFDSEVAAARAYDIAAIKHFGEFALTNEAMGLY